MASRKNKAAIAALLLALLLAGAGLLWHNSRPQERARNRAPEISWSGKDVEILRANDVRPAGFPQSALGLHDRVITHDYGADLMCIDGTRVHLGPLTDIIVEQDPNGMQRLVITVGAMRVETTAQALGMTVGAPFGLIHLNAGEVTVLDVSVSQGAFLRVGSIVIDHNNQSINVPPGHQFTIDGLTMPLKTEDGITLQEITLDLTKHAEGPHKASNTPMAPLPLALYPKAGTRFAPQTRELAQPQTPQPLAQNDRVQTRAPGSTIVADAWGRYLLDDNTDLVVSLAGQRKRIHEAQVGLSLSQGGITVLAPAKEKTAFTTSIEVGTPQLAFSPGLLLGQAHIKRQNNGAQVKLRFGNMRVGERSFEAGRTVVVQGNDMFEGPLSPAHIDIHGDMTSIVHYPSSVPVLNFVWSSTPTPRPVDIEVSNEPGFLDVPFAESIRAGSFMVDQLVGNRTYYWRAGGAEAPAHQVQLESETPACLKCIPPDVISDAVPHTVIEFDEMVTQVAFEWRSFAGAKYYLFRLYNDGQFEKPIIIQHANQPNYLLPPTHLNPGIYYWNVISYDDEGRLLHKGNMSDFEIQEPDDTPPLTINFPKENAVIPAAKLITSGQTRRRAAVSCNGVPIVPQANGHFKQVIPLHKGSNYLVYKVEINKRMRHFYTRTVIRP